MSGKQEVCEWRLWQLSQQRWPPWHQRQVGTFLLGLLLSEPRDIGVRASVYMRGDRRGYLQEREELASKEGGGAVLNSSLL